jgi:uncharacterized SAM-binding protein YcdF (DUF218 family)
MSRICLRCLGVAFLMLLLIASAFVLVAGRWLAVSADMAVPSDAIYVLGGDSGERVALGTALYRKGMAPTIVLTGMDGGASETRPAYLGWRGAYLANQGIPATAITYDEMSTNSREEAATAKALATAKGWKRILVVSDPPHLRRLHHIWTRAFEGSPVEIRIVPTRPRWWDEHTWWRESKSAQFVLMEYIKLAHQAVSE